MNNYHYAINLVIHAIQKTEESVTRLCTQVYRVKVLFTGVVIAEKLYSYYIYVTDELYS